MKTLRGLLRMAAAATMVMGIALGTTLLAWVPIEIRGIPVSAWCFSLGVRPLMRALGIRFVCDDPQRVIEHHGFIFPNHISFFDTLVMSYLLPTRFLSKAEVRKYPLIGRIATATGTIFLDRSDKSQRANVRRTIAAKIRDKQYPPLVIFPEGTRNPEDTLLPFRYGVFEIAIDSGAPYLLCAIHYEDTEAMTWHSRDESLMTTIRRIVEQDTSRVWLIPLAEIQPKPDDDPIQLAAEAREVVGNALNRIRVEGLDPQWLNRN
ncbi:MAG: lysophospholipid acyltransferase family protein [Chloroflexota bacterium]|nr:lysophospholipid acyltransferase family protein [Chloroflexota bacterium]